MSIALACPSPSSAAAFPAEVVRFAERLFRFTLSVRDAEELLTEHGLETSRETIRMWALERRWMPALPTW
jgi:transposase-like protein